MANLGHTGLTTILLLTTMVVSMVKAGDNLLSIEDINNLCEETDYMDICKRTLEKVSHTSSPREFLQVAFQAAMDEVDRGYAFSGNVSSNAKDEFNKKALEGCRQLMVDAAEELQAALITVHDLNMLRSHTFDIKVWLTAVISYQQTCIQEISQSDLHEELKNGLRMIAKITSNAIAILDSLEDLITTFHIPNINFTGRHLTSNNDDNYPSWFSSGDRRLLASSHVKPNVVVAKDGSGKYKTIGDALKSIPKRNTGRYIIHVKAGTYKEIVLITKKMTNVYMYGDGPNRTIVTGSLNNRDGVRTSKSATFAVEGIGFICKNMGFVNTAGPDGGQAVALHVNADNAVFYNCRIDGYQDTLYVHAKRQYYRGCSVSGTVDFIFGDGITMLQNCLIIARRGNDGQQNMVTAQNRKEQKGISGIVIHNCKIVAEDKLYPNRKTMKTYLGRPWNDFARTVFMESTIGDLVDPAGWSEWKGQEHRIKTVYYAEYNNRGPGAGTSDRVKWPGYHVIRKSTAKQFTAQRFMEAGKWIPYTGVPYDAGFIA